MRKQITFGILSLFAEGCTTIDYVAHEQKEETGDTAQTDTNDTSDTGDTYSVDLAPTIYTVTVSPDPTLSNEEFTLEAVITDDKGIDFVTSTILETPQQMSKIGTDTYSITYSASDFSLGTLNFIVSAYDTVGQEATAAGTVTIYDGIAPSLTCTATNGKNDGSELVDILCLANDDDELLSVLYTSDLGAGELETEDGTSYRTSLNATGLQAKEYAISIEARDGSENVTTTEVTTTITDAYAPMLSCSATDGANDGSSAIDISCTVTDETALGTVTYNSTISSDTLVNTSGDVYEASIPVSGVSGGTYTFTIDAFDTTGNTTTTVVTPAISDQTAPTITSVYTDVSSVLNNGTESFMLYACFSDETDGTALGGSVTGTIDTVVETLSYDSGSNCFVSSTINGNNFAEGTYTISVSGADTAGNSVNDSSATIEVIEPTSCPYTCASNICLYVDGVLEAEVNTSFPSQMTSIDTIRLGHSGQYFDNVLLDVDAVTYVEEDFSSSVGCFSTGSVSGGIYSTSGTDNDCAFSPAFDATTIEWMISVDVIAGSAPNLSLRSPSSSSPGVNWDFAANGYINDGAGNSVSFASGTPDASSNHTVMMCNYNL